MPLYLLELYAAREAPGRVSATARDAREAAESLAAEGVDIRYVRSIYVPDDETWFHIYEAADQRSVAEAGRRAGGALTRIVEAM